MYENVRKYQKKIPKKKNFKFYVQFLIRPGLTTDLACSSNWPLFFLGQKEYRLLVNSLLESM